MSDVVHPGESGAGGPAEALPGGSAAPETQAPMTAQEISIRAMADALVQHGALTREKADAMVEADLNELRTGIESDSSVVPGAAPPADPFAGSQLDPVFDRPATPDEYKFPQARSGEATPDSIRAVQELAWQARMPQPIAQQLFEMADNYMAQKLTPVDVELLKAQSWARLRHVWGEQTEAKVALAQRFIDKLHAANPRTLPLMDTGIGSDAGFVMQIVAHAERLYGSGR